MALCTNWNPVNNSTALQEISQSFSKSRSQGLQSHLSVPSQTQPYVKDTSHTCTHTQPAPVEVHRDKHRRNREEVHHRVHLQPEPQLVIGCDELQREREQTKQNIFLSLICDLANQIGWILMTVKGLRGRRAHWDSAIRVRVLMFSSCQGNQILKWFSAQSPFMVSSPYTSTFLGFSFNSYYVYNEYYEY